MIGVRICGDWTVNEVWFGLKRKEDLEHPENVHVNSMKQFAQAKFILTPGDGVPLDRVSQIGPKFAETSTSKETLIITIDYKATDQGSHILYFRAAGARSLKTPYAEWKLNGRCSAKCFEIAEFSIEEAKSKVNNEGQLIE